MFKGNNMNEEIILKSEDGVGIITLNRPETVSYTHLTLPTSPKV